MGFAKGGDDCGLIGRGTIFFPAVMILAGVISSTAQTVGTSSSNGLCSAVERSTVTFQETYQVSRAQKYFTTCGFLGWKTCTRYRVGYSIDTRVAYRDVTNIVFRCCHGWYLDADGSCQQNASEEVTIQQTDPLAPSQANRTTPTLPNGTGALAPRGSSPSSPLSTGVPGSPPGEIADGDGPRTLGKGGGSQTLGGDGAPRVGMIGGLVGVAVVMVATVSLVAIFVSRRRRRAREKRYNSDPGVVFSLINSGSPARAPAPDIYAEIPDRDADANSPGPPADGSPPLKGAPTDDYDVSFFGGGGSKPGQCNTYQDPNDAAADGRRGGPAEPGDAPPVLTGGADTEVTLGPRGAVYAKAREAENCAAGVGASCPYQNLPGLDTAIAAPDIYDTVVGGSGAAPGAYNHLDGGAAAADRDREAYNTIPAGPGGRSKGREAYDKLDRQRVGSSRLSGDDELDAPVRAASGYSALGLDSHRGYDKLDRHEGGHGAAAEAERKAGGGTGPNTYDELGAQGRPAGYDKLRRGSAERGPKEPGGGKTGAGVGTPSGGAPNGSAAVGHEYHSLDLAATPADGDIYENLPKKSLPRGLELQLPPPPGPEAVNREHAAWSPVGHPPAARPVYDVIPGSKRPAPAPSSPTYDTLPKSPGQPRGGAPVYDTPPGATKQLLPHRGSLDEPVPSAVGGARPVYDTPPVRPAPIDETCPLYENTPTGPF